MWLSFQLVSSSHVTLQSGYQHPGKDTGHMPGIAGCKKYAMGAVKQTPGFSRSKEYVNNIQIDLN